MEEAESIFERAFDEGEQPLAPVLPDRVEKIRWFLLPHESWEYGHGRTTPITQTSFQPKSYQQKRRQNQATRQPKPTRDELTRNRSFRLYIQDDPDTGRLSDSKEDHLGDLITIRTIVHSQWGYASMTELDQLGTNTAPKPHSMTPYFPSCGDLSSPALTTSTTTKPTGGVKKIKRQLKAFLWPKKH